MAEINKLVVPISDGQGGYTPTEITFEGSGGGSGLPDEVITYEQFLAKTDEEKAAYTGYISGWPGSGGGSGGGTMSYILRIIADDNSFANKTYTVKDSNGTVLTTGTIPNELTTDIQLMENGNLIIECNGRRALCTIDNPFGVYKAHLNITTVYTLVIDESLSNSYDMCSYEDDCTGFTPAYMDYNSGEFNYGSWENVFFMPKPCMVKYDGTVDYYLDPNDFTKKADGTASDVANDSYAGNAMIEFPTIWTYVRKIGSKIYISVSNVKAGDGYTAYAFHDRSGNVRPYRYYRAYEGSLYDSKLRSLSGKTCYVNNSATTQQTAARANGNDYNLLTVSGHMLFMFLTWLVSKNLNSQAAFGRGNCNTSQAIGTGSLDDKGMFWGSNVNSYSVKVFGIENPWGNIYKRVLGWLTNGANQYVKLTYGTEDGSTVSDYPMDSVTGMISTGLGCSGSSGNMISSMDVSNNVLLPVAASGTTEGVKYSDGNWFATSGILMACVGGYWLNNGNCGVSAVSRDTAYTDHHNFFGACLDLVPSET